MRGDLVPEWLDHYLSTATNARVSVAKVWASRAEA
jgi:hypothetical protein